MGKVNMVPELAHAINRGFDKLEEANEAAESIFAVIGHDKGCAIVAHGKFSKMQAASAIQGLMQIYKIDGPEELMQLATLAKMNESVGSLMGMLGLKPEDIQGIFSGDADDLSDLLRRLHDEEAD